MTIEALEWEENFREYIKNLPLSKDDYKGVIEYIDEGCELLKEQKQKINSLEEQLRLLEYGD